MTAKQVYADVKRLPQAQADGVTLAVVEGVLAAVDRNGDGRVCRQDDSTGRAPGQPSYYSNFVDNVLR